LLDELGWQEAIASCGKIIGLDLSEVAVDDSLHKAPCGGEGTRPNPAQHVGERRQPMFRLPEGGRSMRTVIRGLVAAVDDQERRTTPGRGSTLR
jgi:hypothetical protein